MPSVIIADDHPQIRRSLRMLFERRPDITIAGEACDGVEAVDLVCKTGADVVLLDIGMPRMNGLEAAAALRSRAAGTRVIILSMHNARSFIEQALCEGVAGFILKTASGDEIIEAIYAAMRGDCYFSPGITDQLRAHQVAV